MVAILALAMPVFWLAILVVVTCHLLALDTADLCHADRRSLEPQDHDFPALVFASRPAIMRIMRSSS